MIGMPRITIPKLNERTYEQVEVASVPFVSFIANKNQNGETANWSFVLRGYVRHWLGHLPHSFEERLRGNDSLLCGLVQSRSTSGYAFSEDGVRREEARISTGAASEFSEVGGSIRSPTGDMNSSLNASRAHSVAI
jgi:hypothetical protein